MRLPPRLRGPMVVNGTTSTDDAAASADAAATATATATATASASLLLLLSLDSAWWFVLLVLSASRRGRSGLLLWRCGSDSED